MLILITYDINTETVEGKKRLTKIAKICSAYGQRVQNSVFECLVDATQEITIKEKLKKLIDEKTDNIRFYNLGKKYNTKIESFGTKEIYDPEGFLFF